MEYLFFTLKALVLGITAAVINAFVPIQQFVGATLVMVVVDLVTGVYAAYKDGGWPALKSREFGRSGGKFAMFVCAIIGARQIEMVYLPDAQVVFYVGAFIAIHEFKSVLENVLKATGVNIFQALTERLLQLVSLPAVPDQSTKKNVEDEK